MAKIHIDREEFIHLFPECFKHEEALGGQSMDQIVNLKLYNLANEFVNMYTSHDPDKALVWLGGRANAEEQVEMRSYVKMAFTKLGYRIV